MTPSHPRDPRHRRALIAAVCAALALTAPALAQEPRSPEQRQALVDLAYVLGQSHALRQVCAGPGDQFWRGRMERLIAAEAPDPAFDRRLKESFNTGFAAAQSAFPECGPDSRREAAHVAARGRALTGMVAR
jgi:uncharacterized protein (TIGR02301 family)